jgi:signal transduction histidine kinase
VTPESPGGGAAPATDAMDRGPAALLRGTPLGTKLVLFSTLLAVLVVGLAFAAVSLQIRRHTRDLLVRTLEQHQRTLLDIQARARAGLIEMSRLMTGSPTLRAAMETYRTEGRSGAPARHDLLATVQEEATRIGAALDRDVLVVTDADGRVLAARVKDGAPIGPGADLSGEPLVRRALGDAPEDAGNGPAVLRLGGRAYQAGCVPIVLQGYAIGALAVGDELDHDLALRLQRSLDTDIVIAAGNMVAGTLPAGTARDALSSLAGLRDGEDPGVVRAGGEEFVVAALPLGGGADGAGGTIYLLKSLTGALGPSNRALMRAFLAYGLLAACVAGLGAWLASRAILRPLGRFIAFLRSVAESGDHARRFVEPAAGPEVRTLNATYARLMDSLQEYEQRRLQQARDEMERVERLKESEKLAALGRMLSGAAHEINNPLTGVLGNVDLVLAEQRLDQGARERLEKVRREGRRIVALVRNLLKTAHRDGGQRSIVDLNQLLGECAGLRRHDFTLAGMHLTLDLATSRCRVLAAELELQQVFINIMNNACDALRDSGPSPELMVRTGLRALLHHQAGRQGDRPRAQHQPRHRPGAWRGHLGAEPRGRRGMFQHHSPRARARSRRRRRPGGGARPGGVGGRGGPGAGRGRPAPRGVGARGRRRAERPRTRDRHPRDGGGRGGRRALRGGGRGPAAVAVLRPDRHGPADARTDHG